MAIELDITLLQNLTYLVFIDFTKADYDTFGGVRSNNPRIAKDRDKTIYIVDGSRLMLVYEDGREEHYALHNDVVIDTTGFLQPVRKKIREMM
tara:strand:+ start:46 stop:324 length:279 start_codon:yes stop_codon:yes gene_type:complete